MTHFSMVFIIHLPAESSRSYVLDLIIIIMAEMAVFYMVTSNEGDTYGLPVLFHTHKHTHTHTHTHTEREIT